MNQRVLSSCLIVLFFSLGSVPSVFAQGTTEPTQEERKILDRGEISTGAYVGGGAVGTLVGFGIGHAIQGRYSDLGYVFTIGEAGSLALLIGAAASSLPNCIENNSSSRCGNSVGLALFSYAAFLGFRIWEIIDVWAAPPGMNSKYRKLKERWEPSDEKNSVSFYLLPSSQMSEKGGQLGLAFHF